MKITLLVIMSFYFSVGFGQSEEKVIEVIKPQVFFLNAAENIFGNSRQVIPITLPPKTIKWYYTISAFRNEKDVREVSGTFNLLASLSKVLDATNVSAITLKMLGTPPGSDYCDVFLLKSNKEVKKFEDKDDVWGGNFSYIREGSRERIVSGVVDITPTGSSTQYLAFRNKGLYGVNVSLQVVAIVKQDISINGWTKELKNKLYESTKASLLSLGVDTIISSAEIHKLSACAVKKISKQYTAGQMDNLAQYELQDIQMDAYKNCNNELGLNIDFEQINESLSISKNKLIGKWKAENSTFTLSSTGSLYMQSNEGVMASGTWEVNKGLLKMKLNGATKSDEYQILKFSKDKFTYQSKDPNGDKTVYNAVKIGG